jgi:hypothetical protein
MISRANSDEIFRCLFDGLLVYVFVSLVTDAEDLTFTDVASVFLLQGTAAQKTRQWIV